MIYRARNMFRTFLITGLVASLFLLPLVTFAQTNEPVSPLNRAAQNVIWTLVVNLTGMLLGVGGAILDFSINNFVIGFGTTFLNSGVGLAVNQTWVIIRDFVNLGFIFGLVFIGFKMILGSDTSNTRRWLINLIIAALLVNFSLLMTKVVVDFSNELSGQIAVSGLGATGPDGDGRYTSNVSARVMDVMGISSIFDRFDMGSSGVPESGGWGYIIGTGILFLITAFVFGAGGILLIIRFAVLNIYMMLSPIMFIGWVMPFVGDQMSKYWKGFLKRAFFAPIYLLFIYFGLQVLVGLRQSVQGFGTDSMSYAQALGGADASGNFGQALTSGTTISFFLLACVFMIASLVAAQKLGAEGAGQAIKIGKDISNRAQRAAKRGAGAATFGAAASLGRNTAGRYAYNRLNDDKFKARAASSTSGKFMYKVAEKTAGASFDARTVGGFGKTAGIGEGNKGGYKKAVDQRIKNDKQFLKDIGTVDLDDPANKARAVAKENDIRTEANRLRERAEGEKELFENNLSNSADVFTASITSLAAKITEKELAFAQKEKDGLLTDDDKRARQEEIAAMQADLQTMEAAKAAVAKTAALRAAKDKALSELNASTGTEAEKTRLRDAAEKAAAAYDANLAAERTKYDARIKAEKERADNAKSEAEGSVKYGNQLAYIEKLRQESERKRSRLFGATAGGAVGGSVGTGAAASFVTAASAPLLIASSLGLVGYGAVGAAAASAKTDQLKRAVEDLEKEYGKNGTKKMKKDKRKKDLEDKIAVENEMKGGDKEEDKDGK
ncbi:MAG TPA: hypothetical protein VGE31_01290 [Candidatus Paceibacterota bacterium]